MATPKLKWDSIEGLSMLVDCYFNDCQDKDRIPTPEGLCLVLNISMHTWWYYASGKYHGHMPSYIKKRLKDTDVVNTPPTVEDLSAVDTYDWQNVPLAISGDGGDQSEWSEDHRQRCAVGAILQRAKMKMAEFEKQEAFSLQRKGRTPVFSIFSMKASHGYHEDASYLAPAVVEETQSDSMKIEIMGATPLKIESESGK